MLPTFSPLHLSDKTVDKVMQRECPKGIVYCLGYTDKPFRGAKHGVALKIGLPYEDLVALQQGQL